jgi:hypothetical protein
LRIFGRIPWAECPTRPRQEGFRLPLQKETKYLFGVFAASLS